MNRFEIIFERIGAITKKAPENVVLHRLVKQANRLQTVCDEGTPNKEKFIKLIIDELFYDLIVIASKHGHCGSCLCSNLEDVTRKREYEANVRNRPGFVNVECESCGGRFLIPDNKYDPTKPIICTGCEEGFKDMEKGKEKF